MCDIKNNAHLSVRYKNITHLISLKHSITSSKYFDIRDKSAILYIVTQIGFDCGFQILSLYIGLVKLNIGLEYCFIIVLLLFY